MHIVALQKLSCASARLVASKAFGSWKVQEWESPGFCSGQNVSWAGFRQERLVELHNGQGLLVAEFKIYIPS